LAKKNNKAQLISLIAAEMRKANCIVITAEGDADLEIVRAAVCASEHTTTTLIGEDTDLLVLLLHHATSENRGLYYRSDRSTCRKRIYNITEMKDVLGEATCRRLLFLHAFTGCDATSRIFGIGKKGAFQKLVQNNKALIDAADAFTSQTSTVEEIRKHGSEAMVALNGGKRAEDLSSLRNRLLQKKATVGNTFIAPEKLPPTSDSTYYHSLRSYYQIKECVDGAIDLNATQYGWREKEKHYFPIMSTQPPAPTKLLDLVSCKCTTNCRTARCSCRRYGLPCTQACGPCQEGSCDNPFSQNMMEDEDDE